MTLEDFFTLSELQDGLRDPERVNTLITVMQKEKNTVFKNFAEATRQRSVVANTIAATENKNCLDLFIDLDGLSFIDKWLSDAQNLGNDTESIIALLRAVERLQIDNQRSSSSGIWKTVQNLVAHSSSAVCEKAKTLCDTWMDVKNTSRGNDNDETTTPDKVVDTLTVNQEQVDLLVKSEFQQDVSQLDKLAKDENKITGQDKAELVEASTLSNPLEQKASSVDVDTVLESSIKNDLRADKGDDVADEAESLKTSSNSDDDAKEDGDEKDENTGNDSHFFRLSSAQKTSDMELDYGMIDPLEVARQVAIEVEREVDSREPSCSTSDKMSGPDSTNHEETPPSPSPSATEPAKDAETLVSQISEVAQESEANTGRGFIGFDLNQEVCSEEVENSTNPVSSTISVVSASRAPAAGGLPAAPLQFEGTLGWKGSASTSAFRPIYNNSKQHLDIDLNVAECGEESSVEANPNPMRPERPQLDLNQNGWQSPSRSSSSSSKQPPARKIDLNLNDQTFFLNGASLVKQDESVISIFGTKFKVKSKDSLPQPASLNLGRTGPGLGLGPSMHYGHNGFASGPPMYFAAPMYGSPIPYMVDSRGAPVVPTQPSSPFIMNMAAAGTSSGSSGAHNFDPNTGVMLHGGNREAVGGLRQFFPQVDEHYLKANYSLQSSSSNSIVGGKRHEPDSTREFFTVNKRQQPPWM